MTKRIFINGSMITQQPTGVAVHNINLLTNLIPKLEAGNFKFIVYAYEPLLISHLSSSDFVKKISLGRLFDKVLYRFQSVHRILWNFFFLDKLSKDFDIVYCLSTYGSLNNNKQIITVHDLICLNYPRQHFFQYLYFRVFVSQILKHTKKIIAISNFTCTEILKFYPFIDPEKIEVIHNGVDHIRDKSTSESDLFVKEFTRGKPFCFSVGCSYPHKNCESILAAAELMKKENLVFVLSGKKTNYFLKLKRQAKNRKMTNILFIDYLNDSQLSSFYKFTCLHIYLSKYEGFGFPPAEASYFGTNSLLMKNRVNEEIYGNIFPLISVENDQILVEKKILNSYLVDRRFDNFQILDAHYKWACNADHHFVSLGFSSD